MKILQADTLSHDVTSSALRALRSATTPAMIFGSVARGDASEVSDIDVLELTPHSSGVNAFGRVHVYAYAESRLRSMAEHGALFVLHLKLEGRILRDFNGALDSCLRAYKPPQAYEPYLRALRATANLLETSSEAYEARWKSYNDLAVFIMRTALYVRFAEVGDPVFSLTAIARRLQRQEFTSALKLKTAKAPAFDNYVLVCALVSEFLNTRIHNPFGTIEALVTNQGLEHPSLVAWGLRLLGNESPTLGYDLLTPPSL